jgi:hypothetical protein
LDEVDIADRIRKMGILAPIGRVMYGGVGPAAQTSSEPSAGVIYAGTSDVLSEENLKDIQPLLADHKDLVDGWLKTLSSACVTCI